MHGNMELLMTPQCLMVPCIKVGGVTVVGKVTHTFSLIHLYTIHIDVSLSSLLNGIKCQWKLSGKGISDRCRLATKY